MYPISLTLLLSLLPLATPRLLHRPEDTYAFPKYRVSFLNGLPLLNHTAQKWLQHGLRGGELEFLGEPWKEDDQVSPLKEIGTGHNPGPLADTPPLSLEFMKIGPLYSYLCLIPQPHSHPPPPEDDPDTEVTPVRSWSLLQPLSGTCLYHRQGWFTYSYCHNEQIRQFRELPHSHPHPPGGYHPKEDPAYASYTLGRAPPTPEPGADLTLAEQSALATNLELAREAGSRYLVQRWGDGSICDKTGQSREVEIQFHCSMTMTDTILFVKEAKTCSYVLVINTPRLCGEPGFKSPLQSREEAVIRCREIVDSDANIHVDQGSLPEADQPYRLPRRKPTLAVNPPLQKDQPESQQQSEEALTAMIQRAVKAFMSHKGLNVPEGEYPQVITDHLDDANLFFIDIPIGDMEDDDNALVDALRAAGFDIKETDHNAAKKKASQDSDDSDDSDHTQPTREEPTRDEL